MSLSRLVLRPKLVLLPTDVLSELSLSLSLSLSLCFSFCFPVLEKHGVFILPRYRKSRGTSHDTAVSIWSIDRTRSGATTPGQCGPGIDGNEGILRIPQSSSIPRASPSECFLSYSTAEMQSVYSVASPIYLWVHIVLIRLKYFIPKINIIIIITLWEFFI